MRCEDAIWIARLGDAAPSLAGIHDVRCFARFTEKAHASLARGGMPTLAEQREEGMLYQVLARVSAQAAWEPFQAMTRDPLHAMALVRTARQRFAEVSIIQAESAHLLREQTRRMRAGEPSGYESSPVPSLSATPLISPLGPSIESVRWTMEQGVGGDHDVPYRFEAPGSEHTMTRWVRLMAATQHLDDAPAASAAFDSTGQTDLSEVTSEKAAEGAAQIEPTTVRSPRIA